jgi:hypothetical protein
MCLFYAVLLKMAALNCVKYFRGEISCFSESKSSPRGRQRKEKIKEYFLLGNPELLCNTKACIFVLNFKVMVSENDHVVMSVDLSDLLVKCQEIHDFVCFPYKGLCSPDAL